MIAPRIVKTHVASWSGARAECPADARQGGGRAGPPTCDARPESLSKAPAFPSSSGRFGQLRGLDDLLQTTAAHSGAPARHAGRADADERGDLRAAAAVRRPLDRGQRLRTSGLRPGVRPGVGGGPNGSLRRTAPRRGVGLEPGPREPRRSADDPIAARRSPGVRDVRPVRTRRSRPVDVGRGLGVRRLARAAIGSRLGGLVVGCRSAARRHHAHGERVRIPLDRSTGAGPHGGAGRRPARRTEVVAREPWERRSRGSAKRSQSARPRGAAAATGARGASASTHHRHECGARRGRRGAARAAASTRAPPGQAAQAEARAAADRASAPRGAGGRAAGGGPAIAEPARDAAAAGRSHHRGRPHRGSQPVGCQAG